MTRQNSSMGDAKVLIIDDNLSFGAEMASYLEACGFHAIALQSIDEFETKFAELQPNLLLIDQWLGGTTGTEVLKHARKFTDVPCIVITGRSDPTDTIVNLELGADDHIDKSANAREIVARIKAVLRRAAQAAPAARAEAAAAADGWKLCPLRRDLFRPDGSSCRLTSAEYETLRRLHQSAGTPVSRAEISEEVLHREYQSTDRAVDTIVKILRRKIEPEGKSTVIKSVRPMGYVFTTFPQSKGI